MRQTRSLLLALSLLASSSCSGCGGRAPARSNAAASPSGVSQAPAGHGRIDVHVAAIPTVEGRVIVSLHDERTYLNGDAFVAKTAAAVTGLDMHVVLEKVPPGRYLVVVTHDANANDTLDTSVIGLPTEAYGFSRDARGSFGPPDFDDGAFDFDGESRSIAVELR